MQSATNDLDTYGSDLEKADNLEAVNEIQKNNNFVLLVQQIEGFMEGGGKNISTILLFLVFREPFWKSEVLDI